MFVLINPQYIKESYGFLKFTFCVFLFSVKSDRL